MTLTELLNGIFLTTIPWKDHKTWRNEIGKIIEADADLAEKAKYAIGDAKSISPNIWDHLFETDVAVEDLDRGRATGGMLAMNKAKGVNHIQAHVADLAKDAPKLAEFINATEFHQNQRESWYSLHLINQMIAQGAQFGPAAMEKAATTSITELFRAVGGLAKPEIQKFSKLLVGGKLRLLSEPSMPAVYPILKYGNLLRTSREGLADDSKKGAE